MVKDNGHPKSFGRTLVPLAVSLVVLGACFVTDAASSCSDGLQSVIDGIVYT